MGNPVGFMLHAREDAPKRPVAERVRDYKEIERRLPIERLEIQASRCMDCGIPYCHAYGCPVAALVPDWNEMVARRQWRRALDLLHSANNLPEITGRVCPALCEAACTLSLVSPAVSIRQLELQIVERGWQEGWIRPEPPSFRTGRKVAVIGSGPAGLAAAQQLARRGHRVVVFERAGAVGGILRYGIPDFKLEKWVIDRRLDQLRAEGVVFETGVEAGSDISARYLRRSYDAILITVGARVPRDLKVPGRGLAGVHFALDFLSQQNRLNAGEIIPPEERISAQDKDVAVIGGGDTGSDCVGVCRRQGAREIRQLEILPEPPADRTPDNPWPTWPLILRSSTSHEEGCSRLWATTVSEFLGENENVAEASPPLRNVAQASSLPRTVAQPSSPLHHPALVAQAPSPVNNVAQASSLAHGPSPSETGRVQKLRCVKVRWTRDSAGRPSFQEIPGSQFELPASLVLIAMGFTHAEPGPLVQALDLALDPRGNIQVNNSFMTSAPGVFAAGDAVSGASLVVRAIHLGRAAAEAVDSYLAHLPVVS